MDSSNNDSEEEKSPSKDNEFELPEAWMKESDKLSEKLEDEFIEKKQQEMEQSESLLISTAKLHGNKKAKIQVEDLTNEKIQNHNQESDDKIPSQNQKSNEKIKNYNQKPDEKIKNQNHDSDEKDLSLSSSSHSESFSDDEENKSDSDEGSEEDDPKDSEVKLSDFLLIKLLSEGRFGKVFLVKNTVDGKYYAMKRIRKDLLIEK